MIEYLSVENVMDIHRAIIDRIGGSHGVRDLGALESVVSQPWATFAGEDLYTDIVEKASALGFSLTSNHPFVDGNKRAGYISTRVFLNLNGFDIFGRTDDKQALILSIAAGEIDRERFALWIRDHINPRLLSYRAVSDSD